MKFIPNINQIENEIISFIFIGISKDIPVISTKNDTVLNAEKASITVETYNGRVELKAGRMPEGTIKASIVIKVV